jgi:hypothetical protein
MMRFSRVNINDADRPHGNPGIPSPTAARALSRSGCRGRENQPYPAQQESFATSFWNPSAASFSPSTVVR